MKKILDFIKSLLLGIAGFVLFYFVTRDKKHVLTNKDKEVLDEFNEMDIKTQQEIDNIKHSDSDDILRRLRKENKNSKTHSKSS